MLFVIRALDFNRDFYVLGKKNKKFLLIPICQIPLFVAVSFCFVLFPIVINSIIHDKKVIVCGYCCCWEWPPMEKLAANSSTCEAQRCSFSGREMLFQQSLDEMHTMTLLIFLLWFHQGSKLFHFICQRPHISYVGQWRKCFKLPPRLSLFCWCSAYSTFAL